MKETEESKEPIPPTPDEQKLVALASTEFDKRNYNECFSALSQLHLNKPNDPKVLHNKALVEFLLSECKNFEQFQKHLNTICQLIHLDMKQIDPVDEVDHCIVYYTQAMLYYCQKQYELSLEVINKAYSLMHTMEDSLAHKVCYLLLDVNLKVHGSENTLSRLADIENHFFPVDRQKAAKTDDSLQPEISPFKLYSGSKEFMIKLLHFKAKCHLATKNYDSSYESLQLIYSEKAQTFSTVILASELEILRKNYQKAFDLLVVLQEDNESFSKLNDIQKIIFYNNLGAIHHYLCKPHLCYFYIRKAYEIFQSNMKLYSKVINKDIPLNFPSIFRLDHVQKFVYNVGVSCLYSNKINVAFELLTEAVQVMHTSPLVWLRLAECCIAANKPDLKKVFNFPERRLELVSHAIGTGSSRKLIMNNEIYKDSHYSLEHQSYAIPVPSMDFASLCVRNALSLLPQNNSKLRHAVLAASSYIHLSIGDPYQALKYSNMLFQDETASDLYKYLSRLYKAEALITLDRLGEALQILNPTSMKEINPTEEPLLHHWFPDTYSAAWTISQYNLAVILTIKGDLDKASDILKHIWVSRGPQEQVPIHVISLAIYIELVMGHTDIVKTIIHQNCPHLF